VGIAFNVTFGIIKEFSVFGFDLKEKSGHKHHKMPVPGRVEEPVPTAYIPN